MHELGIAIHAKCCIESSIQAGTTLASYHLPNRMEDTRIENQVTTM
jgi:hypothetical protein